MNSISKYLFYILIVLLAPFGANAQLDIINQYAFGGDAPSLLNKLLVAPDMSGYYLFSSTSADGQSGNLDVINYGSDYLILTKLDFNFTVEWQNSIGGLSADNADDLIFVSDGILISSTSISGVTGLKTTPNYGSADVWVLKLDFNGTIVWQKSFGGTDNDVAAKLRNTVNGDVIIATNSYSQISGTRTAVLKGQQDYWVIKTDNDGEIIWDYSYGSVGSDILFGLGLLNNGTIILSGVSVGATVSHDKTEPPFSGADNWIVAIDQNGSVLWDKTIGGAGSEGGGYILTIEDTIYVLASSSSGVSGLRTESLKGQQDLWLTKLDKDGNIISTHYYGGDQIDTPTGIYQLDNERILLCARSNSNASYDKSENSRGGLDYWGVIVDKNGQIIKEKTLGGGEADDLIVGVLHQDKLILAGNTISNVSGDKTIPKLDPANTGFDIWIAELDATTLEVVNSNTVLPNTYPNPVTDVLTIDLSSFSHIYALDVYDLKGVLISKKIISGTPDSIQLDFSALSNGVYTVLVHSHNGTSALKVVK